MGELLVLQGARAFPKGKLIGVGEPIGPLPISHNQEKVGGGVDYRRVNGERVCIPIQPTIRYFPEPGDKDSYPSRPPASPGEIIIGSFLTDSLSDQIAQLLHRQSGRAPATYIPGFFDPEWAASLPLPSQRDVSSVQNVVLVGDTVDSDRRFTDPEGLQEAYAEAPGTRLRINVDHAGGWLGAMGERISGRLPTYDIVSTLYESNHGDRTFGRHRDAAPGIAFHLRGGKEWTMGEDGDQRISTNPGDVVVLPAGVEHDVFTPADPGHSTHVLMTFVESTHKAISQN